MELTRDLFIPCIDTSKGSGTANYVPIDLSTVFEFAYNPNTETVSYICYKHDTTRVTAYNPTMSQEIVLDNTNAMYKFMSEFLADYPVGSSAELPVLLIRPDLTSGKPTVGELWPKCVVVGNTLNTVDGKLSFDLNFNGDYQKGTVAGVGTNKITFTPAASQAASDGGKAVKA